VTRSVYSFGNGRADGTRVMKAELGGKGANLAEMTNLGVPVPPGFTITTAVCVEYLDGGTIPAHVRDEVAAALVELEHASGKRFGEARNPLLVSVRSGAAVSMPGMMETILNLGLNDETVEDVRRRRPRRPAPLVRAVARSEEDAQRRNQ
jgi:pyruvate, orthophosphate dikinase